MLLFEPNVSQGLTGWEERVCVRVHPHVRQTAHITPPPPPPPPLWPLKCLFFLPYLNHAALVPPELSNPWVVDMA